MNRHVNAIAGRLSLRQPQRRSLEILDRKGGVPFKNVILDYPLGKAMADGFVKEPAVVTRKNFNPAGMTAEAIELMKLQDGVRLHEQVKVELETYARESGNVIVKPFILVIARDTTHAKQLIDLIQSDGFFEGRYKTKVIQVDSSKTGAEEDEMVERLLKVEHTDEPTEIVIHVNMLKEGWDVTNLYTIVPLRAANARILIEQSIGRGLRLPYGKRTGVNSVDRLNIIAHDKFQEIVDEAKKPDSAIRLQQVILEPEQLGEKTVTVVSQSQLASKLGLQPERTTTNTLVPKATEPAVFVAPEDQKVAQIAYQVIRKMENQPIPPQRPNENMHSSDSARRNRSPFKHPPVATPPRRTFHVPTLLLLLALTLPAGAAQFRAGAARSCITPQLGITINGGVGPGTARHIHDDLFVRAIVLDDGATRLAFAVVDTCLVDRPVFDEAKALVARHTGLPSAHIMLSASHTHSAGAVCGVHLSDPDPAYRAWLPVRISDAVRCAVNNLAPADLAWGSGRLPEHVFCRRLLLKPGVTYTNQLGFTNDLAKMNWDSPHPADGEPAGPTDPEVFVLSVRHSDGRPLALLANYSLHYVGDVGPGDISADYFGVFADRIQQLLGADRQDPPFVGILCNGTSGDINNINPKAIRASQPPYTQIRRVADDLAQEVLRVTKGLEYRGEVRLRAAQQECVVATRRPNAAEVAQARAIVAGRPLEKLAGWTDNVAREQLFLAEWPAEVSMPLQVFRIGDLAVAAWPGEIFAASGLELKRRSPAQPLFNVGMANGWYGYIPPPEQFQYGAYETWRMRTSPLETNAIPKMLDGFLGLLQPNPITPKN